MLHIEQLSSGVIVVHGKDGVKYEDDLKNLDPELRRRFDLLQAADEGARIEGVGWHMYADRYWIVEPDDDARTVGKDILLYLKEMHDNIPAMNELARVYEQLTEGLPNGTEHNTPE